jgi:hypothetical protein
MIIYEEPAEYVAWLKLLFLFPIALFLAAIIVVFTADAAISTILVSGESSRLAFSIF